MPKIRQSLPCNLLNPKVSTCQNEYNIHITNCQHFNIHAKSSNLTLGQYIRAILIVYREVKLFTNQHFCNKEARKARWPGGGFPVHATAWGRKTFENVSGQK